MHKKKHILISIIIASILILSFLLWGGSKNKDMNFGTDLFKNINNKEGTVNESSKKTYLHSDNSFSIDIPGDFNSSPLAQTNSLGEETQLILFKGNSTKRDFQVHIAPWDNRDNVTEEKIRKDIPDMKLDQVEKISVAGGNGITFLTNDKASSLTTREIWFSYRDKLYQISTFKEFDVAMVDILTTWKWGI